MDDNAPRYNLRRRDASPKRSAVKPKKGVEKPKNIIVYFAHEDDGERNASDSSSDSTSVYGTYFCPHDAISKEEIEMIRLWSKTPVNVFMDFGTNVNRYDYTVKRLVPIVCPLPKETRIAHALLLERFGIEGEILRVESVDVSGVKRFKRIKKSDLLSMPNDSIEVIVISKIA